jgi:hypothetical protein
MARFSRIISPLLFAMAMVVQPMLASAGILITIAPPILPVYALPPLPGPDYIWAPGYWAYGEDDYYWVPGTWVLAPEPGLLWTPGYWAWHDGVYSWNAGYWGPHIGYYGGVNYGFGYGGHGYGGGYWNHGSFFYNTAVVHVNTTIIHNTYNKTVINNTTVNRVSFNGGQGGTTAKPNPHELTYASEHHVPATDMQAQHEHAASGNHALFASVNHGAPPIGATVKPGVFTGHSITASKGLKVSHTPTNLATGTSSPGKPKLSEDPTKFKTTSTASLSHGNSSQFNPNGPKDHRALKPNPVRAASVQHRNPQHGSSPHNEQHAHAKPKKPGQQG